MKDIEIKVSRETRMIDVSKSFLGNDSENLQGNLIFVFKDEFVDGIGRLKYENSGGTGTINLTKDGDSYKCPIKSKLTKEGQADLQLVITEKGEYVLTEDEKYKENKTYFKKVSNVYIELIEGTDYNVGDDIIGNIYEVINIPIFKSNIFYLFVKKSIIKGDEEKPEEHYSWIEIANQKLIQIDEKIEECENLNLDAERVSDGVKVTITKKDGTTKTVKVNDGEGGGANDYTELINKPKINNIELIGNKSLNDLGIDQDFVKDNNYVHTDNNFTSAYKGQITTNQNNIEILSGAVQEHDQDIQNIANDIDVIEQDVDSLGTEIDNLSLNKQDKLTAGDNITIDENNVISASGGGGGNVDDVQIEGTSIVVNKVANIDMTNRVRQVLPPTSTTNPTLLAVDTIYDLGVQTNLTIQLPSGQLGNWIEVDFLSGSTPTTLSITSSYGMSDFDLVCEANKIYTVYFSWTRLDTGVYGWAISNNEYSRTVVV